MLPVEVMVSKLKWELGPRLGENNREKRKIKNKEGLDRAVIRFRR
jgi:hypothetical protein